VIRPKHVLAIARYTWSGAWRRWVVFVPPALLVLLLLFQLPRVIHVASLFDEPDESWRAIAGFAELVEAVYSNCIVLGTIFALALGTSSTGRGGVRRQIAPILARPLSRFDFVLGRTVGHAMVLAVFWLIPAVAFEALRIGVGSPVRLHPLAYLLPYALHLLVLTGGMAAGSVLRAIPAAFVGMAFIWIVLQPRSCLR
jgi:ABC-type transport system involved in multi-copper enzyme maturation permease subunit